MAITTNYGWTTPDDTALVKDGAAAIRTLGSSVDTTVKALNPGTTAGDLDYYTAATTKARIAKGTAGQVFTMNSGATAPEWQTISTSSMTQISTGSFSSTTITISSIPATYTNLVLLVRGVTNGTGGSYTRMRINGVTTANYFGQFFTWGATAATAENSQTSFRAAYSDTIAGSTYDNATYVYTFPFYATAGFLKNVTWNASGDIANFGWGYDNLNTAAITSITLFESFGYTYNGGTWTLYGVK